MVDSRAYASEKEAWTSEQRGLEGVLWVGGT